MKFALIFVSSVHTEIVSGISTETEKIYAHEKRANFWLYNYSVKESH